MLAVHRIHLRERQRMHCGKLLRGQRFAADIPLLACGISPHHAEAAFERLQAMAGAGGQQQDVACNRSKAASAWWGLIPQASSGISAAKR
jgi:hypothetical protein